MTRTLFAILLSLMLVIFISQITFAHPGATGPSGCHMNYSTGDYHCHTAKTPDPSQIYYYIKYKGNSYGPYSSYSSCMNAISGAMRLSLLTGESLQVLRTGREKSQKEVIINYKLIITI